MIDLKMGDCLELLKAIPDNSVDVIWTDPPYGNNRIHSTENELDFLE